MRTLVFLTMLIAAMLLAACGGDESGEQPDMQGPALIMFTTDN